MRSGVKLVIDHFGKPDEQLGVNCPGFKALLAAVERGRTWVKMSAGFRMPSREAARGYARALLRVSGGERLMWGSDWPFAAFEDKATYAQAVADLHDWVPDAATRRLIARVTASAFSELLPSSSANRSAPTATIAPRS